MDDYNEEFTVENPLKFEGVEDETPPIDDFEDITEPGDITEPIKRKHKKHLPTVIKIDNTDEITDKKEKQYRALEDLRQTYVGYGGIYSNVEFMKNKKDLNREITKQKKLQKEQSTSAATSSQPNLFEFFKPNPLTKKLVEPIQIEKEPKPKPKYRHHLVKKTKKEY